MSGLQTPKIAVFNDVGTFSFEVLVFTVCAGACASSLFCILARPRRGLLLAEEVGKVKVAAAEVEGGLNKEEDVKVVVTVVEGAEMSGAEPAASSSALFNLCKEAFFSESKSFDVILYPTSGGGGSGY